MPLLPPVPLAALTGLLSGYVLSIPVGPTNLTILNEGARRGFRWASLIGLGAATMEIIYCAIAFTGFAAFFSQGPIKTGMELASVVFLSILGGRFLTAKLSPTAGAREAEIQKRMRPHSAFMTGFLRVLGNPGLLLSWIVLAAGFTGREWVQPTQAAKLACCAGVAVGTNAWFMTLSYLVSCRRRAFGPATLLRLEHASGVGLLLLAASQAVALGLRLWAPAH